MSTAQLAGFKSVRGHHEAKLLLSRSLEHNRLASAYLFAGPSGVGKDRLALALAQRTNCLSPVENDACGTCQSCHKIAVMLHPDVIILQRDLKEVPKDSVRATTKDRTDAEKLRTQRREEIAEGELRPNISVEQVEEVLARMPFRPHEGRSRWVIVREAEKILPVAANKLLKTLEEPPRDTHFALITSHASMLLTTIRSRCQTVRFGLLSAEDVSGVLLEQGPALEVDASRVDELTKLGDGSVGRALAFKNHEEYAERCALRDEILNALRAGQPGAIVAIGERVKELDRRDLDAVLTLLQRHFRAEAIQVAGTKPRNASVHAMRSDIVRESQEAVDGSSNLNPQLAVEAMMVRLREVRA
jgi:DNA polymerase III subunit delta'